MEENGIILTEAAEAELCGQSASAGIQPEEEVIPETDDEDIDADIQARIIQLQLQYEAEWEASGRLSAEEAEHLRQEDEEALYREQAQEVIDGYQARRNLLTSGTIRGWRDSMYDSLVPLPRTFWDKWGNRILIIIYAALCLGFIVSTIAYQESVRII